MSARKTQPPSHEEISAAEPTPEAAASSPNGTAKGPQPLAAEGITPFAIVTPPNYSLARTITVSVYSGTGRAAIYYVTEGSYIGFHGGMKNVAEDLLNRLSPPPAAAGDGTGVGQH
jgi:hypothetical protein